MLPVTLTLMPDGDGEAPRGNGNMSFSISMKGRLLASKFLEPSVRNAPMQEKDPQRANAYRRRTYYSARIRKHGSYPLAFVFLITRLFSLGMDTKKKGIL
jgi:hypothetical protein